MGVFSKAGGTVGVRLGVQVGTGVLVGVGVRVGDGVIVDVGVRVEVAVAGIWVGVFARVPVADTVGRRGEGVRGVSQAAKKSTAVTNWLIKINLRFTLSLSL